MAKLSHEEYQMWQAYYHIEPFGSLRDDFRFGQICATMARIVSDEKTEFDATDFIPTFDSQEKAREKDSVEGMNKNLASGFSSLREAAGGIVKRVNI